MTDRRVLRPIGGEWHFIAEEDALRRDVGALTNWRLANSARKMLGALLHEVTNEMPSVGDTPASELESAVVRQIAGAQLAGLGLRSGSAAMILISTGYEPEAGALIRRLVESVLRVRRVGEDVSGEHARRWLSGRAPGSAEKLAQRFGASEELGILSALAHADTRALRPVSIPPGWNTSHPDDGFFDVRPARDPGRGDGLLYAVAFELASFSGSLAELFEVAVQLPRWLSSELLAARDRLPGQDAA